MLANEHSPAKSTPHAWTHLKGFVPFSLCDWPDHTACVLFFGGCNLRCPTCHNAEIAWWPEKMPDVSFDAVAAHIASRRTWLEGLVVSGGEPTVVPGILDALADLRGLGLPVKLDTNGMYPEMVEEIYARGLAEAFHIDVKGPWHLYPRLTGNTVDPLEAQANFSRIFRLALRAPEAFVFRTTQVPLLSDNDIQDVRNILPDGFTLKLQQFQAPRRTYAQADTETRRMSGNMVRRPHRAGDSQSLAGMRDQGPAPGEAACA